ncbi:MAG: N-acetylglucosamine-6-phosphate deacetylase [Clostridia bacterium]|nr:N-acetylglucosamine-6-phosphate deacetylase [Clostridia bacterium]
MNIIKNVRLNGEITDIGIEDGVIVKIGKIDGNGTDFGGAEIYPGLIDIHTHGCVGKDTMECELEEMSRHMLEVGVTTWYPTTMTMSEEEIIKATEVDITKVGGANIPGFHLEGPFINVVYKGAQNEKYVIPPKMSLVKKCKNVKKITIAPEIDGAMEFIKECDAVVSIGHSTCDYDVAKEAFKNGASCLTHTYNCMSPMHHRNPGPIPAGAECGAYAELICDGIHVHPAMVRLLVKLYGEDRVILISDSMRAAGLDDGIYDLGGLPITVKGGVALTENGKLAGSTTNVFACVKNAISFGIPKDVAVKLATENPARLMGLDKKGKIEVGYDADFIIVDSDFNLIRAIARGEI